MARVTVAPDSVYPKETNPFVTNKSEPAGVGVPLSVNTVLLPLIAPEMLPALLLSLFQPAVSGLVIV